jgi:hypothetical protein
MTGARVDYQVDTTDGKVEIVSSAKADSFVTTKNQAYLRSGPGHKVLANVRYKFTLFDEDGHCIFSDQFFYGTVLTAGLNSLLDARFKTGLDSPADYIFLLDGASAPVILGSDTMASHAGWQENVGYSDTTRPVLTLGTIANGAVDNIGNEAVFHLNATGTIAGAGIVNSATKGGSTGIAYDVGLFLDGPRSVRSGLQLFVGVTILIGVA